MGGTIGVIGSINTDLVTRIEAMPALGETRPARSFHMGFGGKGANQAVAAAKLGASVSMVGRVGEDMFGRSMRDNLVAQGVDVAHVRTLRGVESGVAPIFVDDDGGNAILVVAGANGHVDPAAVSEASGCLRRCALLLMQLEIPLETVYHTVDWANEAGVDVCLNPAPAVAGLDLDRLRGVAYLVPNQTELAQLSGLAADTPDQAAIAARSLLDRGIRRVIVTLGADGALLVDADGVDAIAPVRVRATDTTGAGDAFIGAFAAHLAEGFGLRAALHRAVAYAADSVTRAGAQEAGATRAEFETFLQQHGLA